LQVSDFFMSQLGTLTRAKFDARLAERLQQRFNDVFASRGLDQAATLHTARQIVDLAAANGICLESDVFTFADCLMTLQSSLVQDARFPWGDAILGRDDLTGTQKVTLIHDHLLFGERLRPQQPNP